MWPNVYAMGSSVRRRSSRSLANDAIVRAAIVDEIAAMGIDALGPTGVARRAGLTTGAIYGRYESVPEMVVDVWITELRDPHVQLLNGLLAAMTESTGSTGSTEPADLAMWVGQLADLSPQTRAAMEILTTAHRIDELDEVVSEDVQAWRSQWGIGGGDPDHDARMLWALSGVWGAALYGLAGLPDPGWQQSFGWARRAMQVRYVVDRPPEPLVISELEVDTGDEMRDRLLLATMEVISRVGLERTTTSRIARRAGVGQNWIYTAYPSKEDLLVDTMAVLLNSVLAQSERDALGEGHPFSEGSPERQLVTVARSISAYLDPSRRRWRLLRLEAHLAARHRPLAANVLFEAFDVSLRTYPAATGLVEPDVVARIQPLLRYFAAAVLGVGLVDSLMGPLQDMDWRPAICAFGELR